jgi:hypothetical protein
MVNIFKATIVMASMLTGAVSAQANCDNGSLQGQYAFKVQGANVGVFDSAGTLHPFASPLLVNGVGQFTFDGNGSLTKVDYNVGNGTPSITPAIPLTEDGFRTGQTGSYSVDEDCTGNLLFNVPGGRVVQIAFALVDYGQGVLGVVKAEHAPSLPAAIVPAGTSCDSGCDLGDNILIELTKNSYRRRSL